MLGAIWGDIVGSSYEFRPIKRKDFELFSPYSKYTDDTVLTLATMDALLNNLDYSDTYRKYARTYTGRGYGGKFKLWFIQDDTSPYNSFGNGSAMRVSPVGWKFDTLEETLQEAQRSSEVTHNHSEGIKGAQAIASAIFLARTGKSKEEIKQYLESTFEYDLSKSVDEIRMRYEFNETCQGSVPEAIVCFLESTSTEDAIRNAVSLGGDADTQACIAGSIAEAFYKDISEETRERILAYLPEEFVMLLNIFYKKYCN